MPTNKRRLITPIRYWLDVSKCPIGIWDDALNNGYYELRKIDSDDYNEADDFEAWDILFSNFIERIGLNPDFEDYLNKMKQCTDLMCEYVLSEKKRKSGLVVSNRFLLNKIKLLKTEMELFEKTGQTKEDITINQMLQRLSKLQGYAINRNTTTVLDYFDLIKQYQDGRKN